MKGTPSRIHPWVMCRELPCAFNTTHWTYQTLHFLSLWYFSVARTMWSTCYHVHFLASSRSFVTIERGSLYRVPKKYNMFLVKKIYNIKHVVYVRILFLNYLFDIFVIWFSLAFPFCEKYRCRCCTPLCVHRSGENLNYRQDWNIRSEFLGGKRWCFHRRNQVSFLFPVKSFGVSFPNA